MKSLVAAARLGRAVWQTYGARGLRRRGVHEMRRATGAFRGRPAVVGVDESAPPDAGYRPVHPFTGLPAVVRARIVERGERVRRGEYQAFGAEWRPFPADGAAWNSTPDERFRFPDGLWWTVPHLPPGADIKEVWEPARFGWVYDLIRAFHLTGDAAYAEAFHARLATWLDACPPFAGVHWSCGQEAAIRALALLHGEASLSAPNAEAASRLARVLAWSGERIADAVGYGLSQRNNHGISEAAGLVHLGCRFAGAHPHAARWRTRGRRLLDEQIGDQFATDGWYAQHSFVYQRVALSQALAAQRALRRAGSSLSPTALARLTAGADLLAATVDADTGRVPNVGANDGSQVLPLSSAAYDDFRPVITLAGAVVDCPLPADVTPDGEVLAWLGASAPAVTPARRDGVRVGGASGWVVARHQGTRLFMRAGAFRHRPGHMDLLHVHVAHAGREVVTDPGTYAYNAPPPWRNGLASGRVHNAPVLDGAEPAARGPRFLWKEWPTARLIRADYDGNVVRVIAEVPGRVRRDVRLLGDTLVVADEVLLAHVREVACTWLIHPDAARGADVAGPSAQTLTAAEDAVDAWFSPTYGVRVATRAVRVRAARVDGAPLQVASQLTWRATYAAPTESPGTVAATSSSAATSNSAT